MFLEKVKNTINNYQMLSKNDRVLIALSGGPDSLSLFYCLKELKDKYKLKLGIAHLNHGIREDSDDDERFAGEIALKFSLPFYSEKINVSKLAEEKELCLEEAARNARYKFLIETAKSNYYNVIAVGHNKNDQVETFIMRLLRGAGVRGLSSMEAVIFLESSLKLIRPLIECSREEIEEFLKRKKIKAKVDSTNYDTTYLRNRIRHELLPLFKERYNPNIREILFNTVENLQLLANWIERETDRKSKKCLKQKDGKLLIEYRRFKKFHPALQREIIRKAIKRVKGNLRRINYEHWKEIEKLFNRKSGSIVDLPQGVLLKKEKENIYIYRRK